MSRTAMMLMAACLVPAVAAAEGWKVYSYPDAGFAVQFPAPPAIEKSTFRTPAGASLPMVRYAARQDGIVLALDVIDYSSTNADTRSTIAQAEKAFGASGKVTVAIDARINREFGRELSVEDGDGGRSVVAIFFVDKHLYRLVGEALPPNAIAKSGDAIRFQQSLQFIGENGGPGGFGRFAGQGGPRVRGGANPEALTACAGNSAVAAVQLDTPGARYPRRAPSVARPNRPPNPGPGTPSPDGRQDHAPSA